MSASQRTARLPPEQRAALKLLGAPPPVPSLARPAGASSRPEKRRRQLLLNAQDGLAETAAWTREILTPSADDTSDKGASGAASLRVKLEEWQTRGVSAIAVEEDAHASAVADVRNGAARLVADLARLKKAGAGGGGAGEAMITAIRERTEDYPDVCFKPASAAVVNAPKGSRTATPAAALLLAPTKGLVSL